MSSRSSAAVDNAMGAKGHFRDTSVAYRFAVGLTEAALLAALAVVPLYFNPRSERVFESDKMVWIALAAAMVLWALLVRAVEGGRRAVHRQLLVARLLDSPSLVLVLAVALAAVAVVIGTSMSVVPWVSLWGLYQRGQGLVAYAGYGLLLTAAALSVRDVRSWRRLATVVVLVSVPAGLYVVLQRLGIDNVAWASDSAMPTYRPFGALGNPIFLGAYMMLVAPVAAVEVIRAWGDVRGGRTESPAHKGGSLVRGRSAGRSRAAGRRVGDAAHANTLAAGARARLAGSTGALVLVIATLLMSQSRGPALGLLAGVVLFTLLWAGATGRRRAALGIVVGAGAAAVALAVLAATGGGGLGRLGQLLALGSRTARERILLWGAFQDLVRADPLRALVGYGPESARYVIAQHIPAELVRLAPDQVFDRAHNVLWEWWITGGVLGLAAVLLVHGAALIVALDMIGLASGRRRRWILALAMAAGALLGLVLPLLLGQPAELWAVAVPLGMLSGVGLYVTASVWRTDGPAHGAASDGAPTSVAAGAAEGPHSPVNDAASGGIGAHRPEVSARAWLGMAIAAAVAMHLTEGAMGLPAASSELLFWVYIGALIGLCWSRGESAPARQAASAPQTPVGTARGRRPEGEAGQSVAAGALDGLVLAAAVFGTILAAQRETPLGHPAVWLLLVVGWLWADLLRAPSPRPAWTMPVMRLVVLSVLVTLVLGLAGVPGGEIVAFAVTMLCAALIAGWGLMARTEVRARPAAWKYIVYSAGGLLIAVVVWRVVVVPAMAGTLIRSGLRYVVSGDVVAAQDRFERARDMWPEEPEYAKYLGAVYQDRMRTARDSMDSRLYYERATEILHQAYEAAPDAAFLLRLGVLRRDYGDRAVNPSDRMAAWEASRQAFEAALAANPRSPELLGEYAFLLERLGDVDAALSAYGQATDLGPPNPYWLIGLARMSLANGDLEGAIGALEAANEAAGSQDKVRDVFKYAGGEPIDSLYHAQSVIVHAALSGRLEEARAALDSLRAQGAEGPALDAIGEWLDDDAPR